MINSADILAGLRRLGVREGETLMVHASLSRFGRVDGGAAAVVDALAAAVGPAGTVLAPAFTFENQKAEPPSLDILRTPSGMGVISEEVRQRAGRHRSPHLTHSISAFGRLAVESTRGHSLTPCGADSPFARLMDTNGTVVLLGVSLNSVTVFHVAEERLALPYIHYRDLFGTLADDAGTTRPLHSQCHNNSKAYDFNPLAAPLAEQGILTMTPIGNSICRRLEAGRLWDDLRPRLEKDSEWLTLKTAEKTKLPVKVQE